MTTSENTAGSETGPDQDSEATMTAPAQGRPDGLSAAQDDAEQAAGDTEADKPLDEG